MVDWEKAKNEYITKGLTQEKIAEKYKTSLSSVARHSRKELWVSERKRYNSKVTEKCMEKTAEKFAESFADYAATMESEIIEIHKKLFVKIIETMSYGDAFSPRDLKCLSSMLVDLMQNHERMKDSENTDSDNRITVEFVHGVWDEAPDNSMTD